ncbi:MAG: hypothetical protein Q9217_006537 [Psora testacea]
MAITPSPEGQTISEVSKQEGGPSKGSTAAQMQSSVTKQGNLSEAASQVGSKIATDPSSVTSEDASLLHSRESRARGGQQPSKGSLASQAQSLAAANETGATPHAAMGASTTGTDNTRVDLTPEEQSRLDRGANYEQQADKVATKMETNPEAVTKEDANTMHSREQRAFGTTEKGGLASKAQKQVAENMGASQ